MAKRADLTTEQIEALRDFARRNGRCWKRALWKQWMDGYSMVEQQTGKTHFLQQLRNDFGPSWLTNYQFPKEAP